jgi:hypothetical protein
MKNTTFIITLLIITACNNSNNKELNNNSVILKKNFINFLETEKYSHKEFEKIIVIPGSGCTGCISDAEKKFSENYKKSEILYIFTAIGDLKLFKLNFPKDAFNYRNTIIDSNNIMIDYGFNSTYPSEIEINSDLEVDIKPYQN